MEQAMPEAIGLVNRGQRNVVTVQNAQVKLGHGDLKVAWVHRVEVIDDRYESLVLLLRTICTAVE